MIAFSRSALPMRLKNLILFAAAALLSACANEGVVVEKRASASPFTYSLGVDGSFKLILRDAQGNTHSQLVTPDVFNRYEVGDYFNDTQPGPTRREVAVDTGKDSSKEVKPVIHRKAHHRRRHHRSTGSKTKRHLRGGMVKHRDDEAPKPVSPDVSLSSPVRTAPQPLSVTP